MNVLVVYGSERGGTAGLARMIADAMASQGWSVQLADAADDPAIGPVDAVVVGGALYMRRWHHTARHWVRRNHTQLFDLPVWMFSSGPLDDSAAASGLAAVQEVQNLARLVEAKGHMTFGGRLEAHPKGLAAKWLARHNAGDWRDPAQVAEWVLRIGHDMTPAVITVPQQRRARAGTPV